MKKEADKDFFEVTIPAFLWSNWKIMKHPKSGQRVSGPWNESSESWIWYSIQEWQGRITVLLKNHSSINLEGLRKTTKPFMILQLQQGFQAKVTQLSEIYTHISQWEVLLLRSVCFMFNDWSILSLFNNAI
jgi:hypothetical protein